MNTWTTTTHHDFLRVSPYTLEASDAGLWRVSLSTPMYEDPVLLAYGTVGDDGDSPEALRQKARAAGDSYLRHTTRALFSYLSLDLDICPP